MNKSQRILLLIALPVTFLVTGGKVQADAELLSFSSDYGSHGFRCATLVVNTNGAAIVQLVKQGGETNTFQFHLSQDEICSVEALIYSVDFFGQPDRDTDFATCTSAATLKVTLDGKSRSLTYRCRPAIYPLTDPLHGIIYQGVLIDKIGRGERIYDAGTAVMPTRAGPKVFQPSVLVTPLRNRVNHRMQPVADKPTDLPGRQALWKKMMEDGQEIEYALEALAAIMTEEEWMGFLWQQINRASPPRRALFLGKLCNCYGSIPTSHMQAFCHVFSAYVQEHPAQFKDVPEEEQAVTYGGNPFNVLDEFKHTPSDKMRTILKELRGN